MRLLVFSYQRDEMPAADLVVDCRVLDNPYRHPNLRALTGKHPEIQVYVRATSNFKEFWADTIRLLDSAGAGATVAFGCAFGKHRSRAVAHMAREYAMAKGWPCEPISPYVFKDGGMD